MKEEWTSETHLPTVLCGTNLAPHGKVCFLSGGTETEPQKLLQAARALYHHLPIWAAFLRPILHCFILE